MVRARRQPTVGLQFVLVLALVASGCGGGSNFTGDGDLQGTSGGTVATDGTTRIPTAIEPRSFTVGQEAWHSGFRIDFGDGVFNGETDLFTDETHYWIEVGINMENLRDQDWSMYTDQFALVASGNATTARGDSELPNVPGGLASNGKLVFDVDGSFDPATSMIMVGTSDEVRAEIPLGGGSAITLEPSTAPLTGELQLELLDLTFNMADLQYDNPGQFSNVDSGSIALILHFDAVSRKSGNWQIFAQDLALTLPDGSSTVPSASDLEPLPGSDEGTNTTGLSVMYTVPDPPTGDYSLRLIVGDWFVGEDGVNEATYEFSLP